jgi:hypothetical protein
VNDRDEIVNIVGEEADLGDNDNEIWNNGKEKRNVFLMMGALIHCLEGCHMRNDDLEYDMPL